MAYSNLELNSFLTSLMEGWNEQFAAAVVNAFHKIPVSSNRTKITRETKTGTSVTGYTDEAGDVSVSDKETKEVFKGESPEDVARIGHFKVKRLVTNDGKSFIITWHHFWASDLTTMNLEKAPSPMFGVVYMKEDLKPIALVRWDFVVESGTSHLSWSDYLGYLKFLISGFFAGRNTEVYSQTYVASPTVIFGETKLK